MTDDRSAKRIFQAALDVEPAQRATLLERECRGDEALRVRIEQLLGSHDDVGEFLADRGAAEPADDAIGAVFDRYKLLEKIGEGGFGDVYMAEQSEPVRRTVALKVVKLGMDSKQVIARFEAERQAVAMMDHPNIAKVLDAGTTPRGRPYFVMELVRGQPITEYCDRAGTSTHQRLQLMETVCRAVQHAHQKGIIHRDIKPSNVLVTLHDGVPVPKVIDFGIAKATGQQLTEKTLFTGLNQMIGTPEYMAPEQAEMSGLDIDTRADIYALGVLTYELLTGSKPFDMGDLVRAGFAEVLRQIREVEPPRPSTRVSALDRQRLITVAQQRGVAPAALARLMRGDLDWIVMKALEKDRTRRYETAGGLAADLARYRGNQPVDARPPSTSYKLRKYVQRHRLGVAAAGAVALSLVAGAVLAAQGYVAANESAADARTERDATKAALTLAEGERLATIASNHVESDPGLAILLARESARLSDGPAARSVFLTALGGHVESAALVGHDAYLTDARFDPGGRRILTVAEEPVALLWDVASRRVVRRLAGHADLVHSGEFDVTGRRIVTASADGTARVWDAESGATVHVLEGSGAGLHRARFSPDGARVATSAADGGVHVYDVATGATLYALEGAEPDVVDACWFPDGTALATVALDGTVRVWDLGTGSARHVLASQALGSSAWDLRWQYQFDNVLVAPDGERVFTRLGAAFDARSGAPVPMPALSGAGVLALSGSTDRVLVRVTPADGGDPWIETRDVATGATIARMEKHEQRARFVDFRGRVVAVTSRDLTLLDGDTGEAIAECRGHEYLVRTTRFGPGQQFLLSAAADGTARLWDLRGVSRRGVLRPVARGATRIRVQLTRDQSIAVVSRTIAGQPEDEDVVVDMRSGQVLREVVTPAGRPRSVGALASDGTGLVVFDHENRLRVFDVLTGATTSGFPMPEGIYRHALSPDGRVFAAAIFRDSQSTMQAFDAATGCALGPPCPDPAAGAATCSGVLCRNDGRTMISVHSHEFPVVIVWDAETGRERDRFVGHNGYIHALAITPDGSTAATSAVDGTLRTWDLAGREAIAVCRIPMDSGHALALSDDGRFVASSAGSSVLIHDARTGALLARVDCGAPSTRGWRLVFTAAGDELVAFDEHGYMHRWPLDVTAAYASVATRELTPEERSAFRIGTEADRDAALRDWAEQHVSSRAFARWGERCIELGDVGRANVAFERAIELRDGSAQAHLGHALVHALAAAATSDPAARRREVDEGLAALDRALERAAPGRLYDPKDQRLDILRADPRCAAILARHGR